MPIPNNQILVGEVHLLGTGAAGGSTSKPFDFTFHYRRTTPLLPITKAALDAIFQTTVAVPIAAAVNARWTQQSNTVRWVNDALDAPVPFAHALVGGVPGDGMAMHVSSYLLMRTGLRGRSYRGSKHFGPLSEADATNPNPDIMNAASLALWTAVATAMTTALVDANGNTWNPCIMSRTLSKTTPNPTTIVTNDVTLILVNKRFGRMKKREVKSVY